MSGVIQEASSLRSASTKIAEQVDFLLRRHEFFKEKFMEKIESMADDISRAESYDGGGMTIPEADKLMLGQLNPKGFIDYYKSHFFHKNYINYINATHSIIEQMPDEIAIIGQRLVISEDEFRTLLENSIQKETSLVLQELKVLSPEYSKFLASVNKYYKALKKRRFFGAFKGAGSLVGAVAGGRIGAIVGKGVGGFAGEAAKSFIGDFDKIENSYKVSRGRLLTSGRGLTVKASEIFFNLEKNIEATVFILLFAFIERLSSDIGKLKLRLEIERNPKKENVSIFSVLVKRNPRSRPRENECALLVVPDEDQVKTFLNNFHGYEAKLKSSKDNEERLRLSEVMLAQLDKTINFHSLIKDFDKRYRNKALNSYYSTLDARLKSAGSYEKLFEEVFRAFQVIPRNEMNFENKKVRNIFNMLTVFYISENDDFKKKLIRAAILSVCPDPRVDSDWFFSYKANDKDNNDLIFGFEYPSIYKLSSIMKYPEARKKILEKVIESGESDFPLKAKRFISHPATVSFFFVIIGLGWGHQLITGGSIQDVSSASDSYIHREDGGGVNHPEGEFEALPLHDAPVHVDQQPGDAMVDNAPLDDLRQFESQKKAFLEEISRLEEVEKEMAGRITAQKQRVVEYSRNYYSRDNAISIAEDTIVVFRDFINTGKSRLVQASKYREFLDAASRRGFFDRKDKEEIDDYISSLEVEIDQRKESLSQIKSAVWEMKEAH